MQESAFIITMLVSITIVLIALLLMAVPVLITNWQLFAKAGKPGWASIVPVYNVVVMTQIAKKPE